MKARVERTADYVIKLVEEIIGEKAAREQRFPWAQGDPSTRTRRAAMLPFDAVWESRKLIVEIDEDQHREATPHFDKPDRLTVSGVHRGHQRRIYDERRRAAAVREGYTLVALAWPRRRRRDPGGDRQEVRRALVAAHAALL